MLDSKSIQLDDISLDKKLEIIVTTNVVRGRKEMDEGM
jgi:hypothetical protein